MTKQCVKRFIFFSPFDDQIVNLSHHPLKSMLKYLEFHLSTFFRSILKVSLGSRIVFQSIKLIQNIKLLMKLTKYFVFEESEMKDTFSNTHERNSRI